MNASELRKYFSKMYIQDDEIFSTNKSTHSNQEVELMLREKVAREVSKDYFSLINKSHSIEVMDNEVKLFLNTLPTNACILDVGGCWGWHWRRLKQIRPDVTVVILDFVRANLLHANVLLGDMVSNNIILIHDDICSFLSNEKSASCLFDAVWSVQTLQHIPNYEKAIRNIHFLLKNKGLFSTYSLNVQPHIKFLYSMLGKKYHIKGMVDGMYYLERASKTQLNIIEKVFMAPVVRRWTEVIFSPEIFFSYPGKGNVFLGKLDARLSGSSRMLSWFARQQSFHCFKP
jgi:SAM-dependent methyltransferase